MPTSTEPAEISAVVFADERASSGEIPQGTKIGA
jgi:hypothetical protein